MPLARPESELNEFSGRKEPAKGAVPLAIGMDADEVNNVLIKSSPPLPCWLHSRTDEPFGAVSVKIRSPSNV